MTTSSTKQKPAAEVRYGTIRAAIWRNEGDNGPWFTVTFDRSYLDGEEWKSTQSLKQDDLLVAAKVLNEAHTKIQQLVVAERQAQEQANSR